MDGGGHLFRKIQAIQNKAAQRRSSRLNESKYAVYDENKTVSVINEKFTVEQIEATKKKILEQVVIDKRKAIQLKILTFLIIAMIIYLIFYWLSF